jgi:hypothetical protein
VPVIVQPGFSVKILSRKYSDTPPPHRDLVFNPLGTPSFNVKDLIKRLMSLALKIQVIIVVFSFNRKVMPAAAGIYKIGGSGALRKVYIMFVMSSGAREAWLAQGLRFLHGL